MAFHFNSFICILCDTILFHFKWCRESERGWLGDWCPLSSPYLWATLKRHETKQNGGLDLFKPVKRVKGSGADTHTHDIPCSSLGHVWRHPRPWKLHGPVIEPFRWSFSWAGWCSRIEPRSSGSSCQLCFFVFCFLILSEWFRCCTDFPPHGRRAIGAPSVPYNSHEEEVGL